MEKKIISIENLSNGDHHIKNIEEALDERVNWKIALLFRHYFNYNSPVSIHEEFIVTIKDGAVISMKLIIRIDNTNLEETIDLLEFASSSFYHLPFEKDNNEKVVFNAKSVYDMARLTQALDFASVWIGYHFEAVDVNMTVEKARAQANLREYNLNNELDENEVDDDIEESYDLDEHNVAYSKDGKTLLFAKVNLFSERNHEIAEYKVPEGVETISDYAFIWYQIPLRLLIPKSVKHIGDNLFGPEGGYIEIME